MPAIESSGLRLILAMNPGAWQQLHKSSIIGKLQPLTVSPPDKESSIQVLRDSVSMAEYKNKVVFTYQALEEAYDLGIRYVTNQAMPGAALSILEQAATTVKEQKLITREIVRSQLSNCTRSNSSHRARPSRSQLLNLETELHKYVINQRQGSRGSVRCTQKSEKRGREPKQTDRHILVLGADGRW